MSNSTASKPIPRPSYPALQSANSSTSTFQSYGSVSSLSAPSPASAPLPSPSSSYTQQGGFFGSLSNQQKTVNPQVQQQQQPYPQQQRQMSYEYRPNREASGRTAAETNTFLSQYALLAEAAKRAEMAVLARDLGEVEL